MGHRTVGDMMTREVVKVAPQTGFREIVALLREYDITAVPVVEADGRPIGVVSEAERVLVSVSSEIRPLWDQRTS
ncbi:MULTISPECIES: CBS domain-containing protein [unclassified Kitasatospora]|uniref:CBS domain-containing protein n=1 Tax=unclassified Kitasatospora TaxID=2633591 RepID=UPI0033F12536